jgi:DNA-binding transcriptional ArsR family regulator
VAEEFLAESAKLAEIARLFSDETRLRITLLLQKKGEATTNDISTSLKIPQPRVSSHLAILRKYQVVSVAKVGRQKVYSASAEILAPFLKNLSSFAGTTSNGNSLMRTRRNSNKRVSLSIRQCRSCYDHLAGVAGVELLDRMIDVGWLNVSETSGIVDRPTYALTPFGAKHLRQRGVDVERATVSKRSFAYGCQDWTERRPHLGGALGKEILESLDNQSIVKRVPGTRALKMLKSVSTWFR